VSEGEQLSEAIVEYHLAHGNCVVCHAIKKSALRAESSERGTPQLNDAQAQEAYLDSIPTDGKAEAPAPDFKKLATAINNYLRGSTERGTPQDEAELENELIHTVGEMFGYDSAKDCVAQIMSIIKRRSERAASETRPNEVATAMPTRGAGEQASQVAQPDTDPATNSRQTATADEIVEACAVIVDDDILSNEPKWRKKYGTQTVTQVVRALKGRFTLASPTAEALVVDFNYHRRSPSVTPHLHREGETK
jgi:hypothetical protein